MATVAETKTPSTLDPAFLKINALMVMGDLNAALNLWNEALNAEWQSGVDFARENVGENHREN